MSNEPIDSVEPEVTVESKTKLLSEWIKTIEGDIEVMAGCRAVDWAGYVKLKTKTDAWLAQRMRKINRVDKRIAERRKAIKEIEAEIESIKTRPAPGILPPLEPKVKKVKVEEIPTSVPIFTDEERAAMNAEAHSS